MSKWILVLLSLVLAFPVGATERVLLGVNTGVPAQDGQRDLAEKYKPLAEYLEKSLKRPVKLEASQNLSASERRLKKDAFDIFFGPPQVIAQAMKSANYIPVVRYPGKIKAAFVVMDSSGIKSMAETKGKRLGLPDKESLAAQLALAKFRINKQVPETWFSEIFHQSFQDSTLNALKMGRVDVVVVTAGYAKKWVQENPGSRVLEETWEVPQFAVTVSEDFSEADTKRVRQALLDAPSNADGRAMLEKLGHKDGFIATDKDEYSPLIRLFAL